MRTYSKLISMLGLMLSPMLYADDISIQSFDRNGNLSFMTLSTSAVYSIEWASSSSGPWQSSWSNHLGIVAHQESFVEIEVPMVYRIRAKLGALGPTRIVLVGDSLTAQNSGIIRNDAIGYFSWARGFSSRPVHLISNRGVGGTRTSHMLDSIDDVIEDGPDIVILSGGRNDVSHGMGFSYSTNHLTGILHALGDAGIKTLVMNITPRAIEEPQSHIDHRKQLNNWIRELPTHFSNVWVADVESAVIDYETGTMLPGMAHDGGTHWSAIAAARIGRRVASVLEQMLRDVPRIWHSSTSEQNVIENPLFEDGGTGWSFPWEENGSLHFVPSYDYEGHMAVIAVTGGVRSVIFCMEHIDQGRFEPGDTIVYQAEIEWEIYSLPEGDRSFMPFGWLRARNTDGSFDAQIHFMITASNNHVILDEAPRTGRGVWSTLPYTIGEDVNRLYFYAGFDGIERGRVIVHRVSAHKLQD